jgi:hypothetical protein
MIEVFLRKNSRTMKKYFEVFYNRMNFCCATRKKKSVRTDVRPFDESKISTILDAAQEAEKNGQVVNATTKYKYLLDHFYKKIDLNTRIMIRTQLAFHYRTQKKYSLAIT